MQDPQGEIEKKTSNLSKIVVGCIAFVCIVYGFSEWNDWNKEPEIPVAETNAISKITPVTEEQEYKNLSHEKIVPISKEVLSILHRLYFISIDDSDESGYETDSQLIVAWLTDAMKDKNALDQLIPRANELTKDSNDVVRTTAMALTGGMMKLSMSQDTFIKFLRTADPNEPNIAEFQYQVALFGTSNKDAFLSIVEGTALFPYIYLDMEDTDVSDFVISPEEKKEIIDEIDRLFGDIFIDDDKEHELTGNRNAVVVIVRNYRKFIASDDKKNDVNNSNSQQ